MPYRGNRPIQMGDRIIFDYKGKVGDTYFEGGEAKGATLDIGSGQFIPGFEEGMVGVEKEQACEIPVKFPEQYHAEELAGKDAVFEVLVHEVREKELPDVDDDLAKDASEFDTLAEWKEDIRAKLTEAAEQQAKVSLQNQALQAAAQNAKLEIPDAMVEGQMDNLLRDLAQRLMYQGLDLNEYCKYTGMTAEQLRESTRNDALRRCTNQVVLDAITKAEGFAASDEEVEAKAEEYAKRYNQDPETFKKNLTEQDRGYIAEDVAIEKTLAFLVENAKLVEKKEEAPKKAKKATAKKAEDEEEKPKKTTAKKPAAKKTAAKRMRPKRKPRPKSRPPRKPQPKRRR
ncbi:MAG: trigger factor [Christensenellales bacterium]